jgi:hypothetical protein
MRSSIPLLFILLIISLSSYSQKVDSLYGNYSNLIINKGFHTINEPINVYDSLFIMPGAIIDIKDPGALICHGSIIIKGNDSVKVKILGNKISPGNGFIVKSDNNLKINEHIIEISNTIFSELVLPLLFESNWYRKSVRITKNQFINNTGNISIIQVLNPPFYINDLSNPIEFIISNNLFSGNKASLYFENFNSDILKTKISNNTFCNNYISGINNYNISTNILFGRLDQQNSKFITSIEYNSFVNNYLIDNKTGKYFHRANFGIYGTDKNFIIKNNYLGSNNKDDILLSIYDQAINYNSPKVNFEPFLLKPNFNNPSHIYALNALDGSILSDTIVINNPLDGFIFKSNNEINYSNSKIKYTYFVDESSLITKDTSILFDIKNDGYASYFNILTKVNSINKIGFYEMYNIINTSGDYVPEVKIGYLSFMYEYNRRKLFKDTIIIKPLDSNIKNNLLPIDSIKSIFHKVEYPFKSRFNIGIKTGYSIFLGTISDKTNLFGNDKNNLFGLNISYSLFSNLSVGLDIQNFKLSNADVNSSQIEQLSRGISFSTSVLSLSPSINYDFVQNGIYSKARLIKPSFGFGFDFIKFNPTGIYKGVSYDLQPLGTGGQFIDNNKKPYSLYALGYFFNVNIKFHINKLNSIGTFITYHRSMSDYLDDVGSDAYPTIDNILNSNVSNTDAAVYFSNPTFRNVNGQTRSNPDAPIDRYVTFGIYYSFRFFK